MIPTIVARKIASNCHAGFVTPAGNRNEPENNTLSRWMLVKAFMAAPCHGGEAGVIDVGAGDGDAADADAFTVKLEILRVAVAILDLENFGSKGRGSREFRETWTEREGIWCGGSQV
ncbi:hypothetical protein OIU74_008787 [Salix koriyanagi]|uniref:Uncharacterized protein n=1 Tax=Salix koriyanagi TaxID=2511006 RepID=A0A9Q0TQS6_9ROSI|nr:hypothetical protein OIU74_008787 [Salix koriyanagi]